MHGFTLTPYDEFPVHQSSYPFSYIPSTDYSWDDGYYFSVCNPDLGIFLATGLRVMPNTDLVGGYALLQIKGHHHAVRFSRCWRQSFELKIGPYRLEILEPLKKIRLVLEENESGQTFDIIWEGVVPPFLEKHHFAYNRGRLTTDQSRYCQPGRCSGFIAFKGQKWELQPDKWGGQRDHSWGLYLPWPLLEPDPKFLPPADSVRSEEPKRALRLSVMFSSEKHGGFYHLHEDKDGRRIEMNNVYGTPFEGHIRAGWDGKAIELKDYNMSFEFHPGSHKIRPIKSAVLTLIDQHGGEWKQLFENPWPPMICSQMGYHTGSWKDGGSFSTYHGSEELALEFDDFDFSDQPVMYTPYGSHVDQGDAGFSAYRSYKEPITGLLYNSKVTTICPDGSKEDGIALFDCAVSAPYYPANIE